MEEEPQPPPPYNPEGEGFSQTPEHSQPETTPPSFGDGPSKIVNVSPEEEPEKSSWSGFVLILAIVLIVLIGITFVAYYLIQVKEPVKKELTLPEKELEELESNLDLGIEKLENPLDPYKEIEGKKIVEAADFGDAPEGLSLSGNVENYTIHGKFPSTLDNEITRNIRHLEKEKSFFLGLREDDAGITLESDAETVDLDQKDDGVILPEKIETCQKAVFEIFVSIPENLKPPYYLNALADWDHDSEWKGNTSCNETEISEWFLQNLELSSVYQAQP
ncbi:MAG TPA: hypothetical protein ENI70_00180, partial [Candidatus Peregrinibacteria bacterium]|nr:hypothetical protein [Candidatus Peregrinibacteria bacterium]